MATSTTLNFWGVLSESNKIINSHSRHFLALSVLFLLPLSFSLISFPILQHTIINFDPNQTLILLRSTPSHQTLTLTLTLIYAFITFFLSLCAIGTITYSVFHGFYGRPVNFVSAIKSLSNSLLRLFVTTLCAQIILLAVSVVVGVAVFLLIRGIELLGFQGTVLYPIGLMVLGLGFLYILVNWVLVCVIVVVESSWGLEPLRRSAYLVRGMRRVSVSLLLFFGLATGIMVWCGWGSPLAMDGVRNAWSGLTFVLQIVAASAVVVVLLLNSVAANTVLYMYSKALHGELAGEIVEEFAWEYVSLPFDDEKVPHLVSIVQT